MIYLSAAYRHPDPDVVEDRVRRTALAAALLMRRGEVVHAPTVMHHRIALEAEREGHPLPDETAWWIGQDQPALQAASLLVVLTLEGWRESSGVSCEIEIAAARGLPVLYLDPPA